MAVRKRKTTASTGASDALTDMAAKKNMKV